VSEAVGLGSHRLLIALRDHDEATYEHCLAVGRYSERIALASGFDALTSQRIGEVGRLHDVGKVAVPVALLNRCERLTSNDFVIMRDHAAVGGRIVGGDERVAHLARFVRAHHERLDGKGYPDGLRGTNIPLESRVVAVADTFDALTAGRPYREPIPVSRALTIMTATRGLQWDPELVDVFVKIIEREGEVPRVVRASAVI
jgi:HD-GYP domain-containing protein (c-di-GMP phosphodiesterase class II)